QKKKKKKKKKKRAQKLIYGICELSADAKANLDNLVNLLSSILEYDYASVWIVDEDANDASYLYCQASTVGKMIGYKISCKEPMVEQLLKERNEMSLHSTDNKFPSFLKQCHEAVDIHAKSLYCIPITDCDSQDCVAVIELAHEQCQKNERTPTDI
ncbi:hypothetical protein RFI_33377, partial [Reticulomyxa filosa]